MAKIRLWKLGSLEHRIMPSRQAIETLQGILDGIPEGAKTADIIWGPDIDVQVVDDGELEIVGGISNDLGKIKAVADVLRERESQDQKWGGPEHDDTETEENWQKYITEYANAQGRAETYYFRTRMVKVAALAIAAIESHDRKEQADNAS